MTRKGNYVSRLERKEKRNQWRFTALWLLLTGGLLVALFIWGIPLFINFAGWYGDYRSGNTPIAKDDNVPPPPPSINLPYTATNSASLSFGGFAEPGSKVTVLLNNEEINSVVVDSQGKFMFSDIQLQKGFNWIGAYAEDEARNKSAEAKKQQVLYDNQPPELNIEKPQSNQQFFGSEQRRIEVRGTTEPDARLQVNDRLVVVSNNGSWYTFLTLVDGEQTIKVTATDEAGNETSSEVKVSYSL